MGKDSLLDKNCEEKSKDHRGLIEATGSQRDGPLCVA